ncbi:MAG: hypothetical protein C0508_13210, partial [Cyanobacteria bacterium PR.023]|nr:hypothetical protein [Cyanobacteria bacterium PR.023]
MGGSAKNSRLNGSEVAKSLDRLSSLCLSVGDLDRAEVFSQSAASIRMSQDRNRYPDPGLQANFMNLVEICCMKGEYDRAERFLAKAGTLSFNRLLPEVTQSSGAKYDPSEAVYFNAKRMIVLRRFADAERELKRLLAAESYLYGDNFEVRSGLRLYVELFYAMSKPLEAKKVQALVDSKATLSAQDLAP